MKEDNLVLHPPPFNSIISSAFHQARPGLAMKLYRKMLDCMVKPNIRTFTILTTNFAKIAKYDETVYIYREMVRFNVSLTDATSGSLLAAFSSMGRAKVNYF